MALAFDEAFPKARLALPRFPHIAGRGSSRLCAARPCLPAKGGGLGGEHWGDAWCGSLPGRAGCAASACPGLWGRSRMA